MNKKITLVEFCILFTAAFCMFMPISMYFIDPYGPTRATGFFYIIAGLVTFFACIFSVDNDNVKRDWSLIIVFGIIISIVVVVFKATVINFVVYINYADINNKVNLYEKIKNTSSYEQFKVAYDIKDPNYLLSYYKEDLVDDLTEIKEDELYQLITYVKTLNEPKVNELFQSMYEDNLITQKEYSQFKKYTIEKAKEIK